ncbi:MAG: hypothetical protein Q9207_005594 [Kuettlingeria erythrocarpa]
MGRPKDSQASAPYGDDDAASTSSAVPLQEQTFADDEAPPAYTDDPDAAKGPRRIYADQEVPLIDPSEDGSIFSLVPKVVEDSKGSIITYISKAASSDPSKCQSLIEHEVRRSPLPMVRMVGSHVETRQRDKKEERQRVTDFDISAPLQGLLTIPWSRTMLAENVHKTYRGGILKQVDARVKGHAEDAYPAPSLKEWCHRFCASNSSAKSRRFTITRKVTGINYQLITQEVTEVIRGTNYRGHLSITYPVCSRATVIMSDHWINRYRHNTFIWWACVLLQLWIFTWPLLWVMTKRWEVFSVKWPCIIYQQADGTWPNFHQTDPDWVVEGRSMDDRNVRAANLSECNWVEQWKLAIQLTAESRKRGTLTVADRRVAQAIEDRTKQSQDNHVEARQNEFVASATGLLSGIQSVMTLARRYNPVKMHKIRPVKDSPVFNSWKDSLFGWTQLASTNEAYRQHRLLEHSRARFLGHGNTLHFKMAFDDLVVTTEPENVKAMLATNFKDWNLPDRRKATFVPFFGKGIFTSDGAAWQHSRDLLRPSFARSQVSDLGALEKHVDHLVQSIPRDGSTVDLQELFFRLTIDSATEFLFGESTSCLAPGASLETASRFADAFNRLQAAVGHANRTIPLLARLNPNPQVKRDIEYVHNFTDHYVASGLQWLKRQDLEKSVTKNGGRYIFLHELVKATQDPVRIRSELLNMLIAGRDTTASLLGNVFFVLARRPDVWRKLKKDVEELNGARPSFEQIKSMKYLRNVLNETLRLYPVVPFNNRMAVADTVLPLGGGQDGKSPLFIPAGTTVGWHLYTIQRRRDLYGDDADEFKPERWETLRPNWEYLPFNGGPRICLGQQFALTEASYTTIRLMQEFKAIESRDPKPWTEMLTLTCVGQATKVALTPA